MKLGIKLGTRGSKLALYQAELTASLIKKFSPSVQVEIIKIKTEGDQSQHIPIGKVGPGAFTREIEEVLLRGEVDVAVHSAKDLATELPKGLTIAAALKREDSRDCLVSTNGKKLADLKKNSKLGTSSLRRKSQIKRLRPDLELVDLRGNVDTRIRKMEAGECEGMILAYAGVKRLGLLAHVTEIFDPELIIPQAGQGIIALECREDDHEVVQLLKLLNDELSMISLLAERSFLRELEGGCLVPAGVYSGIKGNEILIKGAIFALDGKRAFMKSELGSLDQAEKIGRNVAKEVLNAGGKEILKEIRNV